MIRELIIFTCCLIGLMSCKHADTQMNVHYNQKVNGYDVSAKILVDSIQEEYFSDIVGREAVLTFRKGKHEMKVVNPCYADKNLIESSCDKKTIEIDYTPFNMSEDNTFAGNQSPFFFFDVDFDGEEELIICFWEGMGYRSYHAYQAYKLDVGSHQLSPMQEEPFNELDDYAEFDTINKTISIPQGVGVKMGGKKVYGLVDGSLELVERVQYDWEHTKGVKYEPCDPTIYHYKIVNGTEILDRIEKCPNDK